MPDSAVCDVCDQQPSKYKCPHCVSRYCSILCFKQHIAEHESPEDKDKETVTVELTSSSYGTNSKDQPGETQSDIEPAAVTGEAPAPAPAAGTSRPQSSLTLLQNDARFHQLLNKYPTLKLSLRRLYRATLHPQTQLDTRQESPPPSSSSSAAAATVSNEPDGQARAATLAKTEEADLDEESLSRQWGAAPDFRRWTANKADERAIKMLVDMQARDEGVGEFVDLLKIILVASRSAAPDGVGDAAAADVVHEPIAGESVLTTATMGA